MSDSLRTDRPRTRDAASAPDLDEADRDPTPDRDAKIEQLLLLGLDHYFAARYDEAIHVWTRALFLDRTHARARAYIERARSAVAERQRQSEELLQTGVAAFERGEGPEARRLLRAAIDGGAQADEALAVLDRLNRLEMAVPIEPTVRMRRVRHGQGAAGTPAGAEPRTGFWVTLSAIAILASAMYVAVARGSLDLRMWLADLPMPRTQATTAGASMPVREMDLPLPRRGEAALVRARALAAGGHLRDALAILDLVRTTDPQKPEADRLREDVQRQLLALATPGDLSPESQTEGQAADRPR